MNVAKIQVSGTSAKTVYLRDIPAGIVGARIEIEYTDAMWSGLSKTVVFKGCTTKDVTDAGASVVIPAEVVAKPGARVLVGVYGVDDKSNIAVPTLWAQLGIILCAADPSGDTSTDPDLPVWAQLQAEIEALKKAGADPAEIRRIMEEYLAENPPIVNETDPTVPAWAKTPEKPRYTAAEVGALPADTVIPTVPTKVSELENDSGYIKTVNGVASDENGDVKITIPDSSQNGNGLTETASNLLISILRNGLYSSDQSANITALAAELGVVESGGGDIPDEPDTPDDPDTPVEITYTITSELVNVTSSNNATSVTKGASYTATLAAADGYVLDSVSVIMGGVDVTADTYTDGVIVISAVTGNIAITAEAIAAIDDNFVWVVGTTESTGTWQYNAQQRLTPYKKNGTFVAFTASDDNMMFGDYRGDLYLATIPEGSTLLTVPEHDATWLIAPSIFSADGTRLADPGYNTATIDLTKYPTAVYYGANLKPSDNSVNESDWSTVNASITDFVFS